MESESASEEPAKGALGARESSAGGKSGASGAGSAGGALTEEEQRQGLDDELTRSLSRFDERLARERAELDEKAAAAARGLAERARDREAGGSRESAAGGTGAGGYGRPAPESGAKTAAVPGGGDSVGGDQADLPHDRPDDVGSGEDDDIVARQLREAAEKETDPELREKLWEEYREYKRSSS